MGNLSADAALGREVELYNRVKNNDPTNSAFILVVLKTGHEEDNILRTYTALSTLLAGTGNDEPTNANYARKTLTDADLAAYTVDTTTHTITLPFPTQTYTSIGVGDSWSKLVGCYDSNTTSGTDANIEPVWFEDIRGQTSGTVIVPNGGNILFAWPTGLLISRP